MKREKKLLLLRSEPRGKLVFIQHRKEEQR